MTAKTAKTFDSMRDAMDYVEQSVHYDDNYDVEAIAREVTEWVDGKLAIVASESEYWDAVTRNIECKYADLDEVKQHLSVIFGIDASRTLNLDAYAKAITTERDGRLVIASKDPDYIVSMADKFLVRGESGRGQE